MKLLDLFKAVREENLTKDQLERYRDEMADLYSQMHLELGEVKKKKAIFTLAYPEETNALTLRKWSGTIEGQREIELKSYIRATAPILSSLKSRLYNVY